MPGTINALPYGSGEQMGGKRRGVPVKTLKKILKKAGLKTTGKKAALTRRAKQAKLVKKGGDPNDEPMIDTTQAAKVKTAEEEAEEAKKAAEEAAKTATMVKGGRKGKSRSKKGIYGMGGMFN
jgi:CO dehydrogenase/acetyl-CoA synthase beta subunit